MFRVEGWKNRQGARSTPRVVTLSALCRIISPLLCPDVRAEGVVLLLCFERSHVRRVGGFDTCRGGSRYGFEFRLLCQLLVSERRGALVASLHGVLGVAALSEGDVGVLADFARQGLYQVHRGVLCHLVVGIGLSHGIRYAN